MGLSEAQKLDVALATFAPRYRLPCRRSEASRPSQNENLSLSGYPESPAHCARRASYNGVDPALFFISTFYQFRTGTIAAPQPFGQSELRLRDPVMLPNNDVLF